MRTMLPVVGLAFGLAYTACAPAGGGPIVGEGRAQPRYDLITQDQIIGSSYGDAYELVQRLRPYWIAKGGNDTPQNPGKIQVYLDGTRMGELPSLRYIPIAGVSYIRFFDGLQAASRWGLDHERGVIYVSTIPEERDR